MNNISDETKDILDRKRMRLAVETLERILKRQKRSMSPKDKAHYVLELYDILLESDSEDIETDMWKFLQEYKD